MDTNLNSLFPVKPLLEDRLGTDCFESIPVSPGVYRFYNDDGELLYVGKAKNLRRRLFSYKRAKAGQVSRKVGRLISQVEEIVWVETETERDALLLENRMIRGDRPPFNHANKEPETYYYVYLNPNAENGNALEFRLAMRIHKETDPVHWHGCFKGHRMVRQSFGCLLRMLWMSVHGMSDPMHLPVQLSRNLTPMRYLLPLGLTDPTTFRRKENPVSIGALDGLETRRCRNSGKAQGIRARKALEMPGMLTGLVQSWIKGENCEILDWIVVQIECGEKLPLFQRLHLENHLEILRRFYDQKLVPHRIMRGERERVEQNELDDLMVG